MSTIEITTAHPASSYGVPVCLIDGELQDSGPGLQTVLKELEITRPKLCKMTGKSMSSVNQYCAGVIPVPAEVWNVLIDEMDRRNAEALAGEE